jgi:ArsR family transcriptional regulator
MPGDALQETLVALNHATRRRALKLLYAADELCVCELMRDLRVSQSRMSRHMSRLKAAGLVLDRRDAQWVRYRRSPAVTPEILDVVRSILAATHLPRTKLSAKRPTGDGRVRALA